MKRFLIQALALVCVVSSACGAPPLRPLPLDRANVLPLALDDTFKFRKVISKFNDPRADLPESQHPVLQFERSRLMFGAVTQYDRTRRFGHYYTFFWRADRAANLTVRFEYRQEKLGSFVQAKELHYDNAKGSYKSDFSVIGDDYAEEGKVTAWRAVLIENGKIVALNQSFLWN